MKKILLVVLCAILAASLFTVVGCKSEVPAETGEEVSAETGEEVSAETSEEVSAESEQGKPLVAFLMPTKEQTLWASQGDRLTAAFEGAGYPTIIEFAEDDIARQVSQIENAVLQGAKYLIIVSVDSFALSSAVENASAAGATIIADDRLIMDSESVDYYVTYNLARLGELQGEHIEEELGLKEGKGPFNLEIFSGSPDDSNSIYFYDSAMSVLKPYIDNGQLVVRSGQVDIETNSILKWDSATAQSRMDNILSAYYSDGEKVDAVLAAADCLSLGVISSLDSLGYGQDPDLPFPLVTGQDCELTTVNNMIEGKQSMSIFFDTKVFAEKALNLVNELEAGQEPTIDTTFDNNIKQVPTVLYDPVAVTVDNYEVLIERGFYTEEELSMD